ncbi:hypothetical protein NDU88_005547 [Pleurodeles waltl]|uniref:Uncharacterized protein n=1 Tax=Pleurodeles waltl TaxID=8319 RepID=A0AAV7QG98_PLEWA|nr:hypothetical protein NDU88_005547 [Pleurodeles waltl]
MPKGPSPVSICCARLGGAVVISLTCSSNCHARGAALVPRLSRGGGPRLFIWGCRAAPLCPLVAVPLLLLGAASINAGGVSCCFLSAAHRAAWNPSATPRTHSRCCRARGTPPVRRGPQEGGRTCIRGGSRPTSFPLRGLMRPFRGLALFSLLGFVRWGRPSTSHLGSREARRSAAPLDHLDPRYGWRPMPEAHTVPAQPIPVFRRLQERQCFAN